jgi:hypothetical protein
VEYEFEQADIKKLDFAKIRLNSLLCEKFILRVYLSLYFSVLQVSALQDMPAHSRLNWNLGL